MAILAAAAGARSRVVDSGDGSVGGSVGGRSGVRRADRAALGAGAGAAFLATARGIYPASLRGSIAAGDRVDSRDRPRNGEGPSIAGVGKTASRAARLVSDGGIK